MSNNAAFFTAKHEMAVLKHVLLSNYLIPFATMVTSQDISSPAWYIDAYAGPGRYAAVGGGTAEPGSPLIALGAANKLSHFERPRILNCTFIERNRAYAERLEAIRSTGRFSGTHRVVNADAKDVFIDVVKSVGSHPVLAFVDPFGMAFPQRVLEEALSGRRLSKTEVLFNFHLSSVARVGGLLGKSASLGPSDQKTVDRLDEFLGFDWRGRFFETYQKDERHSATYAAQGVAEEFRSMMLKRQGMRSMAIEVRKARDVVPRFELTLFYRSDAAEYKFADAAQAANAAWRKRVSERDARKNADQFLDALIGEDFDAAQFEDKWKREERELATEWQEAIAANICSLLRDSPVVAVSSSVREIYGDVLGLAGEKHIRAAWKSLAKDRVVTDCPTELMYSSIARGPSWSPAT